MEIQTPAGLGKLKSIKNDKAVVEMEYAHLVEFDFDDCKLMEEMEIREFRERLLTKRKFRVDRFIWLIFTVACFIATPYFMYKMTIQRGYFTFGGETFLPLLPFIVAYLWKSTKELFKIT